MGDVRVGFPQLVSPSAVVSEASKRHTPLTHLEPTPFPPRSKERCQSNSSSVGGHLRASKRHSPSLSERVPRRFKERCQGKTTTNSSMEPLWEPLVGPGGGKAEKLVDTVEGKRMLMTNDLDIDADGKNGVVYFTDGSTRWQRKDFFLATLEGQPDGRFMQYDIATGQTKVLVKGVAFANGVALSRDRTFVVFCETSYMRCHRYFIRGPKTGKAEQFVNLPGYPDNVSLNPRGRFWIAINSRRTPMSAVLARSPYARSMLLNDPVGLQAAYVAAVGLSSGITVEVDNNGVITDVLEDKLGRTVAAVSEVVERKGKLWIGSVMVDDVAVLKYSPPNTTVSNKSTVRGGML
ncbi:unnamed protein product [Closterium sp. Yama58-4]|nr:unnamed protein product [Closterium sp. Yama58-4]